MWSPSLAKVKMNGRQNDIGLNTRSKSERLRWPISMSPQSSYTPAELETQVSGPVLVTEKASGRYHGLSQGWNPQTVRGRSEGRVDRGCF